MNTIDLNPFIFYEMEFDTDLLTKYYGKNLPGGIYAIPEDSVNPNPPEEESPPLDGSEQEKSKFLIDPDGVGTDDNNIFHQKAQAVKNLTNQLASIPQSPDVMSQMTQDQQQQFINDILPIKKVYLLTKLATLASTLRNNFMLDTDLEIVLKYGANLSYDTLVALTLNILNKLKQDASVKLQTQQQGGQPIENNGQEQI